MKIILQHLGKRFNYDWIFRGIEQEFISGRSYAVLGPNGSGKSTLLKVISGQLSPSEGVIQYSNDQIINADSVFKHLSYAAPYIELIEEFTLHEFFEFHCSFKKIINDHSVSDLIEICGLGKHKNKLLKSFSSGMKQRVKLTASILSKSEILLLDEPSTNLDKEGVDWYMDLIKNNLSERIVIIGSNMEREYNFCDVSIDINRYK